MGAAIGPTVRDLVPVRDQVRVSCLRETRSGNGRWSVGARGPAAGSRLRGTRGWRRRIGRPATGSSRSRRPLKAAHEGFVLLMRHHTPPHCPQIPRHDGHKARPGIREPRDYLNTHGPRKEDRQTRIPWGEQPASHAITGPAYAARRSSTVTTRTLVRARSETGDGGDAISCKLDTSSTIAVGDATSCILNTSRAIPAGDANSRRLRRRNFKLQNSQRRTSEEVSCLSRPAMLRRQSKPFTGTSVDSRSDDAANRHSNWPV